MKIGILGAGNVGAALARAWAAKAHQVMFGVSNPKSERVSKALAELGGKARAGTNAEAAAFGEVVALAIPWPAAEEAIRSSGSLAGKVLIDSTNPLSADFKSLTIGHSISAGEMVAGWSRGARVVKAFNYIGAANYRNADFAGQRADGFYCGDDAGAKSAVKGLVADAELNPVDVGPLPNARLLEPLAMLWIDVAFFQGGRPNHAFKLLKR